jgi:DNA-binding response OmpR family regulator
MAGSTVLIVDDVADNLEVLDRRFRARGFNVHVASTGRTALQIIAEEQIDIVLLDIMMLDVNGIDVLRLVRAKFSPARLPILIVSARDDESMIVHALAAGANDYVVKPYRFGELLARTVTHLRVRGQYINLRQSYMSLKRASGAEPGKAPQKN